MCQNKRNTKKNQTLKWKLKMEIGKCLQQTIENILNNKNKRENVQKS